MSIVERNDTGMHLGLTTFIRLGMLEKLVFHILSFLYPFIHSRVFVVCLSI